MRSQHAIVLLALLLGLGWPTSKQTSFAAGGGDWKATSIVSYGIPVEFCIEGERPMAGVSLSLSAFDAGKKSTITLGGGGEFSITTFGRFDVALPEGCHTLALNDFRGTPAPPGVVWGEPPNVKLEYWEHIIDMGAEALPGVERVDYTPAGTSTVYETIQRLQLKGRVYVDCYGTDDACIVLINGVQVRYAPFGQVLVFDITQLLMPNTQYAVSIVHRDNNRGKCWDAGNRIGDSTGWKAGAHYANTTCAGKLRKGWMDVYSKTYFVERSE